MWLFLLIHGACISHSSPDLDLVTDEFQQIHPTVYEIYREPMSEEALHHHLEQVFVGRKLTQEYIEHYTTLHHMQVEETSIDVKQVDYNEISVLDFAFGWVKIDVDWSVGGVVTHQGHKHTRVNRYRAVYTLLEVDTNLWRISDVKMRNAERIRRATDEDILNGKDAGGGYLDPMDLLEAGMFDLPTDTEKTENQETADKDQQTEEGE